MRILFAGTPEIALPSLRVTAEKHTVCAVLTNPDRVRGRGKSAAAPPVKEEALRLGLPVLQPERLNAEARKAISAYEPDLLAVTAYGKIFGPKFLALFPRGGINLHPSLLPRYRGPSPINAAILNGDRKTGVTIQRISQRMDAGDILAQEAHVLDGSEDHSGLSRILAEKGAALMTGVIDAIEAGEEQPQPQNEEEATYCSLIKKEDGRIDWSSSAVYIERMTRAFRPWPGVFTRFKAKRLFLLRVSVIRADAPILRSRGNPEPGTVIGIDKERGILVQTGNGVLGIQKLKLQSKKEMEWNAFLNGAGDITGTVLGED
jgi:methionyl-tRNA formyltransferase